MKRSFFGLDLQDNRSYRHQPTLKTLFGLDLQANRSNRHQPTLKTLMGECSNKNSLEVDESKSLNQPQETQDATHEYAPQKNFNSNGPFNGYKNRQQASEEAEVLLGNEKDKIEIETTSTNWGNQAAVKTKTGFESSLNGTGSYQDKYHPQSRDAYSPIQTGSDLETTENRVLKDWEEIFDRDIKLNGYIGSRIIDASGDGSKKEVFEDGALEISYYKNYLSNLKDYHSPTFDFLGTEIKPPGWVSAGVTATKNSTGEIIDLGRTILDLSKNSFYVNLKDKLDASEGWFDMRSQWKIDVDIDANYANGTSINLDDFSEGITMIDALDTGSDYKGDITAETFYYTDFGTELGSGRIYQGRGGTDTLELNGINKADILNFNGSALDDLGNSAAGGAALGQQAFYGGTVFDVLSLKNGDEIYLQGIEKISCEDGDIRIRANMSDSTKDQWNLQAMDVSGAWRFNRGSSDVVLVSLDNGIGDIAGNATDIHDEISHINNKTAKNNSNKRHHGHQAMSVMSAKHDSQNVAGIAPGSELWAYNVYDSGTQLYDAIEGAKADRVEDQRLVFQGGIQGDWWTSGATKAEMQTAIDETEDYGFFAIAAGNYGDKTSVSGVAQAETTNGNVASIGALMHSGAVNDVDGITNYNNHELASYSNAGANLTLVAPTESPSINGDGDITNFGGTSCANPNVAGVAALVWSENTSLSGSDVRDLLTHSAMDLGDLGRDNTFGHGLVNAEAAVRRSYALAENEVLASFYSNDQFLA